MKTAHAKTKTLDTVPDSSPERISHLSESLASSFDSSLKEISKINLQSRLLSFNAQVEAARAGHFGASFSVVASEMQKLSQITENVASQLESEANTTVTELKEISQVMATNVRGTRLADLALVNIDLIDRNLYERTCDVRWWATDSAVVSALESPTENDIEYASKRLGIILDAYTVYYDIVLCDLEGTVIANGRPSNYNSTGSRAENTEWFKSSIKSSSADDYGFQSVARDPLVNDQLTITYSCAIFDKNGKKLGVLGILFNWEALAQTIVKNTPIDREHAHKTRCCIVDDDRVFLADSQDEILKSTLHSPEIKELMKKEKAFVKVKVGTTKYYIAHAYSPGFETYSTGWHSIIIQEL